jgi:hypothetical protein
LRTASGGSGLSFLILRPTHTRAVYAAYVTY